LKKLPRAIQESRDLAVWIADEVGDREIKSDDRRRLSAGLISISMWHHSSIAQLYALGRYASGLALVRSVIDCFARSLWAAYLATDEDLKSFVSGDDPPSTPKIINELEKNDLFEIGTIAPLMKRIWPVVCDFNHGGGRMVVRHLASDAIGPNFEDEEIAESLLVADRFVIGAACSLADLMEDRELGQRFLARLDELIGV
jgi:hypothetical protein